MIRIRYLLWCSDLEATRFTLGMSAILWAILLAWPGELFPTPDEINAFRGRMTYALMAQIADEEVWAALWALQGSVMLYSLFTGHRNCLLMGADAMLGCALWSFCVFSAFLVYWPHADFLTALMTYKPPAAMAGEIMMVAASWWVLVRYNCGRH